MYPTCIHIRQVFLGLPLPNLSSTLSPDSLLSSTSRGQTTKASGPSSYPKYLPSQGSPDVIIPVSFWKTHSGISACASLLPVSYIPESSWLPRIPTHKVLLASQLFHRIYLSASWALSFFFANESTCLPPFRLVYSKSLSDISIIVRIAVER